MKPVRILPLHEESSRKVDIVVKVYEIPTVAFVGGASKLQTKLIRYRDMAESELVVAIGRL